MSVEKPVFAIITCSDTRGPECDTEVTRLNR